MESGEAVLDQAYEKGPRIAVAIGVEVIGGAFGYAVGMAIGAEAPADTAALTEQMNDLQSTITSEQAAIDQLEHSRPATNIAIQDVREAINGQQGQIAALQGQKEQLLAEHPGHDGPYGPVGAGVGMLAAAALAVTVARRVAKKHRT